MGRARVFVFAVIATAAAACSLLVDTSGLESGDTADGAVDGTANGGDANGGPDGTPPPPPGSDGGLDAADASDGRTSSYYATVMADAPLAYFRLGDAVGTTVAKHYLNQSFGGGM